MGLASGTILKSNQAEYTIVTEIARGGMGAIYQAEDRQSDRAVAIKEACLDPVVCAENIDQIRERLTHEMQVLMPLNHPNIPRIYDQFSGENNAYLVMELIEGQTLMLIQRRVLARNSLIEESRVLGWAVQILDALAYLHSRPKPIIHRDIKPENLILSADGRVMLVDFGLMKQVERQVKSGPLVHAFGTVEFAPPEQYADGAGTDQRTDIYSLGATMYFLLAGKLPPKAVDRMLPTSINISLKLPSLRKINSTVSRQTERVISKAMEIDPEQRYQSAREMREAVCPRRSFIPLPF